MRSPSFGLGLAAFALLSACGPVYLPQTFPDFSIPEEDSGPSLPDMRYPGTRLHFVINAFTFPQSSKYFAIDLNGDSFPDNQLGAVNAALVAASLPIFESAQYDSILSGETIDLLSVSTADATLERDPLATAEIFIGDPSPNPKFDGTDALAIDQTIPETAISGSLFAMGFTSPSPVKLTKVQGLNLRLVLGASVTIKIPLTAAYLTFTVSDSGVMTGQLNGAVRGADLSGTFIPGLAKNLDLLAKASPCEAQCVAVQTLFPADKTVQPPSITAAVLTKSATLQNALLPDVQLFDATTGAWAPNANNRYKDSFSLGIGFTAVSATFNQ